MGLEKNEGQPIYESHGKNLGAVLCLALSIRLIFLFVGLLIDSLDVSVRYTDIDYEVYCGAARALLEKGDPYNQETFRYVLITMYSDYFLVG